MEITKDTLITDLLAMSPYMEHILLGMGMHCISCAASGGETLGEALAVHGYKEEDISDVVEQLKEFVGVKA